MKKASIALTCIVLMGFVSGCGYNEMQRYEELESDFSEKWAKIKDLDLFFGPDELQSKIIATEDEDESTREGCN